jgi:hypothetical protein
LSVGYWETTGTGAELVRDSCSVDIHGVTSFIDQVLISDDITPGAVSATISGPPNSNFAAEASAGWTATSVPSSVPTEGQSITSITLSVTEPEGAYAINLQASPRVSGSETTGVTTGS